jgi:hypothetical protein
MLMVLSIALPVFGLILIDEIEGAIGERGTAGAERDRDDGGRDDRAVPFLVGRLVVLKLFVWPAVAWFVAYRLVQLPPA